MSDFLAEVSLATDQDTKEDSSAERVTLMTAHAAKRPGIQQHIRSRCRRGAFSVGHGLEFPTGNRGGKTPAVCGDNPCQEILHAIVRKSRFRNGQTCITRPSRFISDIDRSHLKMAMGSDITATTWTDSTSPYRQFMPQRMALPQNSGRTPQVGHHRPPMPPKQPAGAFAIHTAKRTVGRYADTP